MKRFSYIIPWRDLNGQRPLENFVFFFSFLFFFFSYFRTKLYVCTCDSISPLPTSALYIWFSIFECCLPFSMKKFSLCTTILFVYLFRKKVLKAQEWLLPSPFFSSFFLPAYLLLSFVVYVLRSNAFSGLFLLAVSSIF